jgi:ribonuclease Z
MKLPFRILEPTFFAGLLDDPVLWLRVRPWRRSLLVDCGQIHHLAKRVLRSVDAVFVSHAHMDHFMGLDSFLRQVHVAPRTVEIYGPPGLADKMEHKLAGYDWNLYEDHWCTLRVHEVHAEFLVTSDFPGPAGFARRPVGRTARSGRAIFANRHLTVEADLCDHKLPVLALRITECAGFTLDSGRLARSGLIPGPWLRELKRLFFRGELAGATLKVPCRRGEAAEAEVRPAAELYLELRREGAPASIGYLTDVGFQPDNLERIRNLLRGVTLLVCECSFLNEDQAKARASWHLCSDDVNRLLEELRPAFVLPMHLSKAYLHRTRQLYAELQPPPGTTVLRLPDHVAPKPLLPGAVPEWTAGPLCSP